MSLRHWSWDLLWHGSSILRCRLSLWYIDVFVIFTVDGEVIGSPGQQNVVTFHPWVERVLSVHIVTVFLDFMLLKKLGTLCNEATQFSGIFLPIDQMGTNPLVPLGTALKRPNQIRYDMDRKKATYCSVA